MRNGQTHAVHRPGPEVQVGPIVRLFFGAGIVYFREYVVIHTEVFLFADKRTRPDR